MESVWRTHLHVSSLVVVVFQEGRPAVKETVRAHRKLGIIAEAYSSCSYNPDKNLSKDAM